ncbi:YraN family protein [Myxococcota bacterium]|nr:YraN family protein [Myxococcota bacterium]
MPSPTQRWGAAQEKLAEEALAHAGYTVLDRNWRGGGGEVDLVAWKGGTLCFVEVRARSTAAFGSPAGTVGPAKQRRVIRAASAYLMRFRPGTRPMVRFDVVSIVADGRSPAKIELLENAFDASR